jgi:hypothetical protein
MSYFGLSSADSVSSLFDTSSSTYSLLKATADYSSYKTLNSVAHSLKAGISSASSDESKAELQDRLDAIMETLEKNAPAKATSQTLSEQAKEQADSILSSLGLGTTINTTA